MNSDEAKRICEDSRTRLIGVAKDAGISYEPSQGASTAPQHREPVERFADALARCPDEAAAGRLLQGYGARGEGYVVGFFLNYAQEETCSLPAGEIVEEPNPGPYFYLATFVNEFIKRVVDDEAKRRKDIEEREKTGKKQRGS